MKARRFPTGGAGMLHAGRRSGRTGGLPAATLLLGTAVASADPPDNIGVMWHFYNGAWQELQITGAG